MKVLLNRRQLIWINEHVAFNLHIDDNIYFGYLFLMKDEYEKALVSLQQALQIDEKIFGKYHENVATRLLNISECLRNLNRTDEALNALLKSREIDILNYGMGNPILAYYY